MKKNNGAKTRLSIMQGRGADICSMPNCGEEIGVKACMGCGEPICKDCLMDHNCSEPEPEKPKATRQV